MTIRNMELNLLEMSWVLKHILRAFFNMFLLWVV